MIWLLAASTIWGFSFGILKSLALSLDPFLINAFRTGIAAIFFLPWFLSLTRQKPLLSQIESVGIFPEQPILLQNLRSFIAGGIQIGLMYGPYTLAFRYLKSHEVAFFTMTTPLFVAMIVILGDFAFHRQYLTTPTLRLLLAATLATLGGIIVSMSNEGHLSIVVGSALVQVSNLLFALGLFLWSRWFEKRQDTLPLMTPFFLGAFSVSIVLCIIFSDHIRPPEINEWLSLIWLGGISSGLGFYLWNKGALRVNDTLLSVSNNLKLPIAIAISILIFNESANIKNLLSGLCLITLALWLGLNRPKTIQSR